VKSESGAIALIVAALLVVFGAHQAVAKKSGPDDRKWTSQAKGDSVEFGATGEEAETGHSDNPPAPPLDEYTVGDICNTLSVADLGGAPTPGTDPNGIVCTYGIFVAPECEVGKPVQPQWTRHRDSADAPWGQWVNTSGWSCSDQQVVLTAADFRRLPLPKPALTVQPDRGWVLVNKETVVYSSDEPATLRTTLAGHKLEVEATPAAFDWVFGDGGKLHTTDPGKAWPHQTVEHTYSKLGSAKVSVTATWTGRYRVAGATTWRDVVGTAATTATSNEFQVVERRAYLSNGEK